MNLQKWILSLAFLILAVGMQAQTATPVVKDRQVNQQKKILKGAKQGKVDKKEFVRLERQQRRINRSKKRAKADGKVTRKERAGLHKRQNRANRNIRRAKKN